MPRHAHIVLNRRSVVACVNLSPAEVAVPKFCSSHHLLCRTGVVRNERCTLAVQALVLSQTAHTDPDEHLELHLVRISEFLGGEDPIDQRPAHWSLAAPYAVTLEVCAATSIMLRYTAQYSPGAQVPRTCARCLLIL